MFKTIEEFKAELARFPGPDTQARAGAEARNALLTKPEGALGRLEDLALWYAAWRGDARPQLEKVQIAIFAGNHGVAAKGVSAYPPEVTVQMVANYSEGGAAINQLARVAGADLSVHPLDLDTPTGDITEGPAMTEAELCAALSAGWEAVDPDADLFVAGEMGIGNTTIAAVLSAAFYGGGAGTWVGRGTGVDEDGLSRKAAAVEAALDLHADAIEAGDPVEILRCLGGREVAAMTGAYARARVLRIPVVLDGFISCAAASVLSQAVFGGLDHAVAGHCSAESAHLRLLNALGMEPVLRLGLRLGEGSGAAAAVPLLKAAVACHSGMASFGEAGVSERD
ncbi:nicotinate-nucleotide--dimethylbenzimidazole phosphoribosyltransferase [Poseidonocella sp. HB161398]|uniref:nicotinate-nucleotide--dimethylbenzimidazole phosphoribosyltransferase n=1 Tax=Poseidonocella sp. HB161398 TaxID=2320855 RepID=UPI00110836D5|nr:nicotinate-nucleotide--dimethylbenzimidazole phosphoribosyltransferase [Poseidonocella sp. HB161398]